ncbi:MAG TPA: regulator [Phycisphaerae bacterium]|nr:regulator [Phycisphaerae bacterium]HUU83782.1 regulator [Phycisphaerae bacterium]
MCPFGSRLVIVALILGGLLACAIPAPAEDDLATTPSPSAEPIGMPYIYTEWEQFTTKDGLPNDHIFAVKVDGDRVWIGTENGLACLDKKTRKIRSWGEDDGLPWRVVAAIDVQPKTGDVWLGLFGGGMARFSGGLGRFSGGRFDHWHQLNSGLVNDVVYGVAVEHDNIWAATTAGASRYNTVTGEWSIFTEKNAPMEEIWNYGVCYADGLVYLGVWGSGVLEYNVERGTWKDYLDPDGEMEIDLYRDDGIVHVITTGVSYVDKVLWATTYFGASRYDGRHWRGYLAHDCGLPSDFNNAVKGRTANEAWFGTDKGLGVLADFETDTWVTYTTDHNAGKGKAVVQRGTEVLAEIDTPPNVPHNYVLWVEFDGDDAWIATSKGLGHAIGRGYYAGLRPRKGSGVRKNEK